MSMPAYTPCKNNKFLDCKNYTVKCEKCLREHENLEKILLLNPKEHKDYYEVNNNV